MNENNNNKNEEKSQNSNNNNDFVDLKKGFFKKVWYSITKIEKYPDMAAEGLGKAVIYISKLVVILSIVLTLGYLYKTNNYLRKAVDYIGNQFPEFSYEEGNLNVEQNEKIEISSDNFIAEKIIVDTKINDETEINKYINSISNEDGTGILILKDRAVLINYQVAGTTSYEYKELFGQMGITKFTKQDIINYANGREIISLYVSVFLIIFIYAFILYLLTTLTNALFLSVFGYLASWIARIKMRYVAIFNMAVYSLTLSTILNIIYIAINIFRNYNIEYFQVMYTSVAAIYLVAAIFILKSEFIKKQAELMKIVEKEAEIKKDGEEVKEEEREENKEPNKKEENENTEKEEQKEEKKKQKKKEERDNNLGTDEVEGSNA